MFFRNRNKKIEENNENPLMDNIKQELLAELGNKGVVVTGIKMQLNPKNISLSIYLKGNRRLA